MKKTAIENEVTIRATAELKEAVAKELQNKDKNIEELFNEEWTKAIIASSGEGPVGSGNE